MSIRIPETLVSQYFAALYPAVAAGGAAPGAAEALLIGAARRVLEAVPRRGHAGALTPNRGGGDP